MVMLLFWTCTFILCTQPLISNAKGTVETAIIDPLDLGRVGSSVSRETKEWVDPFDMTHYSHAEKKMVKDHHYNDVCKNCRCERNIMEKNFLRRLVNLLINHCQNEGTVQETSILLTVNSNQLLELYRLKDAADSEATVRALNGIFSHISVHHKSSFLMDIVISEEVWSNIAAMSFALLPICVFLMGGTTRKIVLVLSLAVFAVSYFKTQKLMLKKLEVQNEHILMKQNQCIPRARSWFSFFSSDNEAECIKQLHAQKIDPSLEVTPIQVITHMAAVGLLQPMDHFGIMFSRFSKQIFDSHSMLYGLLVFPFAAFIVMFVIAIFCAGVFGKNLSLGTKHISIGMTDSVQAQAPALPPSEKTLASVEPAPETQVARKPNTEMAIINQGYPHQPVIQIIHNYPIKHVDEPAVRNDNQIKFVTSEKEIANNSEMKSVESVEESHKIHEITPHSSSTKHDTSKTSELKDAQK